MTSLDAFADALIAAHQRKGTSLWDGPAPTSPAEAYQVQTRIIDALGPVAGFKVGLRPDHPPVMAPIRTEFALSSGATVIMPQPMGIELEVGWKIIAPLPDPARADFAAALLNCVQPVPVIELVDTRLAGPVADDAMAKLADFQINHGLIIGTPLPDWDGRDFSTVTARMQAGDSVLLDGPTEVPGGSAIATLRALLGVVGAHCGGLQVGHIVITGSLHPLTYVNAPCAVHGSIGGLGPVGVILE